MLSAISGNSMGENYAPLRVEPVTQLDIQSNFLVVVFKRHCKSFFNFLGIGSNEIKKHPLNWGSHRLSPILPGGVTRYLAAE